MGFESTANAVEPRDKVRQDGHSCQAAAELTALAGKFYAPPVWYCVAFRFLQRCQPTTTLWSPG
jgi:hypothetical protein